MKPDAVVMSVIPTLERLRQEDQESHATLNFKSRPCLNWNWSVL